MHSFDGTERHGETRIMKRKLGRGLLVEKLNVAFTWGGGVHPNLFDYSTFTLRRCCVTLHGLGGEEYHSLPIWLLSFYIPSHLHLDTLSKRAQVSIIFQNAHTQVFKIQLCTCTYLTHYCEELYVDKCWVESTYILHQCQCVVLRQSEEAHYIPSGVFEQPVKVRGHPNRVS